MRIFVLGAGATGSLLAHLLEKQGHTVWCGDRDPQRARRFLGKKSTIPIRDVNARNLWGILRAARGCHLIVNASASVFNEIVMRAALRLRAHYLDLSSHLTRNPFKSVCTRARRATIPFRSGPRRAPSMKQCPIRGCTAGESFGWASGSANPNGSGFQSR